MSSSCLFTVFHLLLHVLHKVVTKKGGVFYVHVKRVSDGESEHKHYIGWSS
jgi:hypothetical protein